MSDIETSASALPIIAAARFGIALYKALGEGAFRRKKQLCLTFDSDLGVKVTYTLQSTYHVTCASAEFEIAMSNGLGGDAFTVTHYLTLILAKVTQNVSQYPLHHVTIALTKFKVPTFNINTQ